MRLPSQDDVVVELPPGGFRRWLKSDMRILRWIFLLLYLGIVGGLVTLALHDSEPAALITLAIAIVSQLLFIIGGGTVRLCQPIRRRRLALPVVIAALMLTVLVAGFILALSELTRFSPDDPFGGILFWSLIGVSWLGWGVLLFFHVRDMPRYRAMSRLATYLFAGSLAELIATVPAHIIVSRRPGCLVGLLTMLGIVAGIGVMLFSFGPMIVLLFLRPRLRAETFDPERPLCPACGYDLRATPHRCPECGLFIGA